MKKFFTLIAAAFVAVCASAQLISFSEEAAKGTLGGKVFEVDGFKLTLTDNVDGGKLLIDANNTYFGTLEDKIQFSYRLRTSGKSDSKNHMDLTIPADGTLKVYVRTGSNSATDRNIILSQNGEELVNKILLESEAVKESYVDDDGADKTRNIYPIITTAVKAGEVNVTYPKNSINIYAFELVTEGGNTPAASGKVLVKTETYSLIPASETAEASETLTGTASYFYNAAGANFMSMPYSSSKVMYTYNENGTIATSTNYSWNSGWTSSNSSTLTYAYDEEGNVISTTDVDGNVISYTYEKGVQTSMTTPYYSTTYQNTFNEQGQLIQHDQVMPTTGVVNQRTIYVYNEDGTLASETTGYVNGDELTMPTETTYTYNADGTVAQTNTHANGRWGETWGKTVYTYAEMKAAYVPQNVTATAAANNKINISWDAVEGATKYNVIYDNVIAEVEGTSFETPTLLDGDHDIYVQAIIEGVGRNLSEVASASVKDEGKLPASDFKVISMEEGEDQWGSVAYNTTVQWTMPANHSEVAEYKVYYGTGNWDCTSVKAEDVTIVDGVATATIPFSGYQVGQWDNDEMAYVLQTKELSVVVVYATGAAEASNSVKYDFLNNTPAATVVTIENITTLIDQYLSGEGTVTIGDITTLIDQYLAQ